MRKNPMILAIKELSLTSVWLALVHWSLRSE
jgi:hypothetical protein